MRRNRPITVQLARDSEGQWIATVPSLGLTASGATSDEALTHVRVIATQPIEDRASDEGVERVA